MNSQSRECQLELNDINDQSCEQSDSESEDEVVQDSLHMELQTGGDHPAAMESQISKDFGGEVPILGMVFHSENQAYNFYNDYAGSVGFSIRKQWATKRKTDKKILKRIFCCSNEGVRGSHTRGPPKKARPESRTNCNARIVIKLQEDGNYVVIEFIEEHNHELAPPSKVHMLRSQRKTQDAHARLIGNTHCAGIGSTNILSCTHAEGGGSQNFNVVQVDCNNDLQRKRNEILKKGDAQVLLDYFKHMQSKDPCFFYSIQMDEDNQMCSCFWCDAKSRIDYSFFGDVVCFDTIYKLNGNDISFASIIGVNNHGHSTLFGCALLLDETTESLVWLFETFLDAMYRKQPKTIFTDQAMPIAEAIKRVLPNTYHRLCLWHIYQNALKHLSFVFEAFTSFTIDFKSCIYGNETEEEFQSSWDTLLEKYNLVGNGWLQDLYQMREKWAQAYGREYFCAGVMTTQRSEDLNNYFMKYFKVTLSLQEFITQYEEAVTRRREKEKIEEFNFRKSKPNLLTEWTAEERAAAVYTRNIFSSFQKEYLGCMDLFLQSDGEDGTLYTYKVSSYRGYKPRTVTFDCSNSTVKCSCKKFEFTGILCAHALKILHSRELPDIPSQYYLKRWTKDATTGVVIDDFRKTVQVDCQPSLTLRYSELAHIALTLAVKGARTEKSGELVKRELTRLLEEIDYCLKIDSDQPIPHEDFISANYDNVGEVGIADHLSGGIKHPLEKARGTRGQSGQVSVGGIRKPPFILPMVPNIPMFPFNPARPMNMPHYTQGSIGLVEQSMLRPSTDSIQYGQMSGGWSAQPLWHGCFLPLNVVGCPSASSIQGLSFRAAGPSKIPLMPYVYTQGSVRHLDQATTQHGTKSSQGQQSSAHRPSEPSTQQCPTHKLDTSKQTTP